MSVLGQSLNLLSSILTILLTCPNSDTLLCYHTTRVPHPALDSYLSTALLWLHVVAMVTCGQLAAGLCACEQERPPNLSERATLLPTASPTLNLITFYTLEQQSLAAKADTVRGTNAFVDSLPTVWPGYTYICSVLSRRHYPGNVVKYIALMSLPTAGTWPLPRKERNRLPEMDLPLSKWLSLRCFLGTAEIVQPTLLKMGCYYSTPMCHYWDMSVK